MGFYFESRRQLSEHVHGRRERQLQDDALMLPQLASEEQEES